MAEKGQVQVVFVQNAYGIKAGDTKMVDKDRADELVAARVAELKSK